MFRLHEVVLKLLINDFWTRFALREILYWCFWIFVFIKYQLNFSAPRGAINFYVIHEITFHNVAFFGFWTDFHIAIYDSAYQVLLSLATLDYREITKFGSLVLNTGIFEETIVVLKCPNLVKCLVWNRSKLFPLFKDLLVNMEFFSSMIYNFLRFSSENHLQ